MTVMIETADRRKRARLQLLEPAMQQQQPDEQQQQLLLQQQQNGGVAVEDTDSVVSDEEEGTSSSDSSNLSWMGPPKGFLCPLTMDIMLDPVLDAEGNTFERSAIVAHLKEHRSSPVSGQPLNERVLIPNHALRDVIHEFMGPDWVASRMCALTRAAAAAAAAAVATQTAAAETAATALSTSSSHSATSITNDSSSSSSSSGDDYYYKGSSNEAAAAAAAASSDVVSWLLPPSQHPSVNASLRYRAKIDCYLQATSSRIGGLDLRLNDQGCCAFRYDNITIVLDVPEQAGVFCLYTRELVPLLTPAMKDKLLELNFLQGDTRGGCLSVKKHADGHNEVMFSYTDRVTEVSSQDFCNILLNFVETAVNLRSKLMETLTVGGGGAGGSSNNGNGGIRANLVPAEEGELEPPSSSHNNKKRSISSATARSHI